MGFLATPVVGLLAGAIILGESLGPLDVLGFALVIAGIAAASLLPALRAPQPGAAAALATAPDAPVARD
jgi:drug/metabolite transporter (DMT)-like permease